MTITLNVGDRVTHATVKSIPGVIRNVIGEVAFVEWDSGAASSHELSVLEPDLPAPALPDWIATADYAACDDGVLSRQNRVDRPWCLHVSRRMSWTELSDVEVAALPSVRPINAA